jgi:hypothetical protein
MNEENKKARRSPPDRVTYSFDGYQRMKGFSIQKKNRNRTDERIMAKSVTNFTCLFIVGGVRCLKQELLSKNIDLMEK